MSREMNYREQLLQAVDAFLEKTPSAHRRAKNLIQHGYTAIHDEAKILTIDGIIWGGLFAQLTDSVFYESEQFLREMREVLLGHASRNIASQVFSEDYRSYFTTDEREWYAQLVNMVDFVMAIPFAQIHEATSQARLQKETWATMQAHIPEIVQVEKIEEEYQHRKTLIETIATRSPLPKHVGDEKIYHLVLQEVTSLLTNVEVGKAAVYFGYPILRGFFYLEDGGPKPFPPRPIDITEGFLWARRTLNAIAGKEGILFLTWRLRSAPTFDGDLLIVSFH